jgi:hypothetical protein
MVGTVGALTVLLNMVNIVPGEVEPSPTSAASTRPSPRRLPGSRRASASGAGPRRPIDVAPIVREEPPTSTPR